MTLGFPNASRSFDEGKSAVRFTGYDGMFEISFFVETTALDRTAKTRGAKPGSEAEYLAAFDAARASIQDVARKVYSDARRPSYILTASDLR